MYFSMQIIISITTQKRQLRVFTLICPKTGQVQHWLIYPIVSYDI